MYWTRLMYFHADWVDISTDSTSCSSAEIININIIKFYQHLFRHEKLFFKEKECKQTVSLGGYGDCNKTFGEYRWLQKVVY